MAELGNNIQRLAATSCQRCANEGLGTSGASRTPRYPTWLQRSPHRDAAVVSKKTRHIGGSSVGCRHAFAGRSLRL